ncbi:hypothetical protein GMA8713_01086 [Grimontia marina]|uniref:Uncharacterized protein n=2 Tax=Grimontia marina TaxID=646534 RepID=A0A128EYP2_9GAMM|nr:hypothetical protein GMA8713_01086 [Grimontia marina]
MDLAEAIGESVKTVGAEESASIMARALCWLAQVDGNDIEFTCDLGTVTIECAEITAKH